MFKLVIMVSLVIGCSIEEETSELASLDSARGEATIPIERADVNRDGEVNVLDLTAVSYWIGEKVADWLGSSKKIAVEREVSFNNIRSELLQKPEIEVGKFFSMHVWAHLDGGMRFARDFFTDGKVDPTCRITTEIVAQNAAGEVIPDAIASFNAYPSGGDDPTPAAAVSTPAYSPAKRVNGQGYGVSLLMFLTSSALHNNVTKLVVKSGSKCGGYNRYSNVKTRKKLTPVTEVAQIPITIRDRSDDLTVVANLVRDSGSLQLEFSRRWGGDDAYSGENTEEMKNRTESRHLAVMLVDNLGIQRGYFSSEKGVASGHRFIYPEIGTTVYGGSDLYGYTIYGFGPRTVGGSRWWNNQTRFACGEGWRVLILLQDIHKVVRAGTLWVPREGTTTIYEGDCRS